MSRRISEIIKASMGLLIALLPRLGLRPFHALTSVGPLPPRLPRRVILLVRMLAIGVSRVVRPWCSRNQGSRGLLVSEFTTVRALLPK